MKWHKHSSIEGLHAFLSPSGHAWLKYDKDKLITVYNNMKQKELGTKLHEMAANDISMGMKRPANGKSFNRHVNDAISYRMDSEVPLYFDYYCFGTADAISFRKEKGKWTLRIHDLKTGKTPVSMDQLKVYAALFFLEYGREIMVDIRDCYVELRIYQNDVDPMIETPTAEEILDIMANITEKVSILKEVE